jgi:hypothetical protein
MVRSFGYESIIGTLRQKSRGIFLESKAPRGCAGCVVWRTLEPSYYLALALTRQSLIANGRYKNKNMTRPMASIQRI